MFSVLQHACVFKHACMLAVAHESAGQPLPQVSEEGHSRSSPVLCEAPRLLIAYCRLHFVLQDCKLVVLTTYVINVYVYVYINLC